MVGDTASTISRLVAKAARVPVVAIEGQAGLACEA